MKQKNTQQIEPPLEKNIMYIYEPRNHLEVDTPKGRATVWLVTDYGTETEKMFTCLIKSTGEIWEFTNSQIKATSNITFGRNLTLEKL